MSLAVPQFDKRARSQAISAMLSDIRPLLKTLGRNERPRRQYTALQREYASSETACTFAACRALHHEASDDEIRTVASAIDLHSQSAELIPWRLVGKSSGKGYRPICELPPILKAKHYLIHDLLAAAMPSAHHLYDVSGRGTSAAIIDFKNALEEGYDWCWYGDIRDCFQTVEPDALINCLPLPRPIVANWIDYRCLNLSREPMSDGSSSSIPLYMRKGIRRNRPRGLLQGSPASNLILATLLASLAPIFDLHDCFGCLIADNLFVAAKSKTKRDAVAAEISEHLFTHPAGRFRLHKEGVTSPKESLQMLGWLLTPENDEVTLQPTHAAIERMWGKLVTAEHIDAIRADGSIVATQKIVNGYAGSFKAWADAEDLLGGVILSAEEYIQILTMMKQSREVG